MSINEKWILKKWILKKQEVEKLILTSWESIFKYVLHCCLVNLLENGLPCSVVYCNLLNSTDIYLVLYTGFHSDVYIFSLDVESTPSL